MTMTPSPMTFKLRDLLTQYPSLTTRERAHMVMRWRLCPMRRIAALVPTESTVLDLGCGHGLFSLMLAMLSPARQVIGIDLDSEKIRLAQTLKHPNLSVRVGDITQQVDLPPVQAITILDVLYLIPHETQASLIAHCVERLPRGGVLVLKEAAESPRWKARLNILEEMLVVRALGITATQDTKFYFRTRTEWTTLFESLGCTVETFNMDAGYYHAHVVFRACKQ